MRNRTSFRNPERKGTRKEKKNICMNKNEQNTGSIAQFLGRKGMWATSKSKPDTTTQFCGKLCKKAVNLL